MLAGVYRTGQEPSHCNGIAQVVLNQSLDQQSLPQGPAQRGLPSYCSKTVSLKWAARLELPSGDCSSTIPCRTCQFHSYIANR